VALELGASVYGEAPWTRERHSLEELLARPPWMADAACAEHPELRFVPGRGEPTEPLKGVCRRCLVLDECLAFAMADESLQGVWGGTSTKERNEYRKLKPRQRWA
jgi:WhiB family redox-sensing transcriptional regulator